MQPDLHQLLERSAVRHSLYNSSRFYTQTLLTGLL